MKRKKKEVEYLDPKKYDLNEIIKQQIENRERFMLFILGLIIGSLVFLLALTLINISRWF